ncbi:hypothetical protein CNYM01_13375 [Colletotrichum nymphaeae SA-01]|uniref:Uncharacterized protein n=1 Tax=Colletotrichum nymphaeae SA-01 TaxID=1460502 RepID=A0A135UXT4_9PEZI|nr:hypothetical protein CNYM01_13375 [Colletotrichum nymphaeae SA-01]
MTSLHSKPRLPRSPSTPGCSRPQVPERPQNPTESYRHRPRERTADLADSSAPHPPLVIAPPKSPPALITHLRIQEILQQPTGLATTDNIPRHAATSHITTLNLEEPYAPLAVISGHYSIAKSRGQSPIQFNKLEYTKTEIKPSGPGGLMAVTPSRCKSSAAYCQRRSLSSLSVARALPGNDRQAPQTLVQSSPPTELQRDVSGIISPFQGIIFRNQTPGDNGDQ